MKVLKSDQEFFYGMIAWQMSVDGMLGEVQPTAASWAYELFNCNVSLYIGSMVCTVSHNDTSAWTAQVFICLISHSCVLLYLESAAETSLSPSSCVGVSERE